MPFAIKITTPIPAMGSTSHASAGRKRHRDETHAKEPKRSKMSNTPKSSKTTKVVQKQSRTKSTIVDQTPGYQLESNAACKTNTPSREITYPFFTQTVSLWVPLFPVGFDRPLTSVAHQHIAGLVNHYVPLFGGYLLSYHNVNFSEDSTRADQRNPPTDATPAVVAAVDEYAVGFGWMTADVELFVPSRGAWLEGRIILQNEGAIGVSCWEKFNASIEAIRLPRGWKYVETDGDTGNEDTGTHLNSNDNGKSDAIARGYWEDESGTPVTGKLLFRIKDFDVGLAGDNGFLAIEGTMLADVDERNLLLQERKRRSSNQSRLVLRSLPEFSITQFGRENEEEDSGQRTEVYKGSAPGSPN